MNKALPLAADLVHRSGGWFGPSTVGLVVVIALIACLLYFVPGIDATLRKLLIGVAVVLFVVWLLLLVLRLAGGVDV